MHFLEENWTWFETSLHYLNGRGAIVPEFGSRHQKGELCRISLGNMGAEKYAKHCVVTII